MCLMGFLEREGDSTKVDTLCGDFCRELGLSR